MKVEVIHKPNGYVLWANEGRLFAFPIHQSSGKTIDLSHYDHMPYEIIKKEHADGYNFAFKLIMPANLPTKLVIGKDTPFAAQTRKMTHLNKVLEFLDGKPHLFADLRKIQQYKHLTDDDRQEVDYGAAEMDSAADSGDVSGGGAEIAISESIQRFMSYLKEATLIESKSVGTLYHTTKISSACKIIQKNELTGPYVPEYDMDGISTSRNKAFIYDKRNMKNYVQFVLDGDKISHNHKVIPYDYWHGSYRKDNPTEPQIQDEDEEIVLTKDGLKDVKKYIINVNVIVNDSSDSETEVLINLLKKSNIKHSVAAKSNINEVFLSCLKESVNKDLVYKKRDEGMFQAAYFGKSALRYRLKRFPHINDGDPVYEMHIELTPEDQGKGLAVEMIKAFLWREGGTAWFSHGRILNPNVYKVIDKIRQDPKWLVQDYEDGITIEEK